MKMWFKILIGGMVVIFLIILMNIVSTVKEGSLKNTVPNLQSEEDGAKETLQTNLKKQLVRKKRVPPEREVRGRTFQAKSQPRSLKWLQGGNLHRATLAEWQNASYRNKLATASDWLAGTRWEGHLNSLDDFDRLKVKAQMLVEGVDRVVAGWGPGEERVTVIAAGLVTMSNDLGP